LGDKRIEVYIRCTTCNFEQILRVSTEEIERLRTLEMGWQARNRAVAAKHGVSSSLAIAQLNKLRRRRWELEDEIA
jgi:hypothetical protein